MYFIFLLACARARAQSFPVIINNTNQGISTNVLSIFTGPSGGSLIAKFDVDSKLVASGVFPGSTINGSDQIPTSYWWQVDLPGSSGPVTGYVAAGTTFSNPVCGANYITATTTVNLRQNAGDLTSYVQVNGANGHIYSGQNFAYVSSTTVNGTAWYQIYLTNTPYCSQKMGWVSSVGGAVKVSTSNGLPQPVLSDNGYNGTSVQLGWTMTVEPRGSTNTSFQVWRSVNGGGAALLTTTNNNAYSDNSLSAINSYSYYVVASYNSCSSQNSNVVTVGNTNPNTYAITGRATFNGNALSNVTITTSPSQGSTTTDANGNYSISVPLNYSGTVSAALAGYNLSPASLSVSSGNNINKNFTATANLSTYVITGNVTLNGSGLANVSITTSPTQASAVTDANGNYTIAVPLNFTGTISAGLSGYTFSPSSQTVSSGNNTNKNFTATVLLNAYTITGKVTYNGSGLSNVNISTNPSQGSATTDASGNYSISVPIGYAGSVSASLSGYTFSPASQTVSSASYTGKNFTATLIPLATINITSATNSSIPPWQRAGDAFNGTVTVDLSNAQNNPWYLEIDVYQPSANAPSDFVFYPASSLTSNSITFNSTDQLFTTQISTNKLVSGCRLTYSAVLGKQPNKIDVKNATVGTTIIDAQWVNKNVIYYNDPSQTLQIPLKYIPGTTSVDYFFSRVAQTSSENDNIETVPPVPMALRQYITEGYFTSSSNIAHVSPGVFKYTVNYNGVSPYSESGVFDLTKIGRVVKPQSYAGTGGQIIVLIGGITNTVEKNVQDLNLSVANPGERGTDADMSIISYLNGQGFNTWYIAQPDLNSVIANAYDVGLAIMRIESITQASELDVICHSKGGLEIKALLGTANSSANLTAGLDGSNFNNGKFNLTGLIGKVAFLATPHLGSAADWLTSLIPGGTFAAPGYTDLKWDISLPGQILHVLQNTVMPASTKFLNLTDYGPTPLIDKLTSVVRGPLAVIEATTASELGDGAVNVVSSLNFYPNNGASFMQLFQDNSNHYLVHESNTLSNNGLCTSSTAKNIDYIQQFFRGTLTQPCNDIVGEYTFQLIESVLSGASISRKTTGSNNYQGLGVTDENGQLNLRLFDAINIGDSIKITANGVDSELFAATPWFIATPKLRMAMFSSINNANKIMLPSLSLVNQNPITSQPIIQLKVSGKNVGKYLINAHNSNSLFAQAFPAGNLLSVPLDTGYNSVIIKCIGIASDTVTLSKAVYYLPDALMNTFARDFSINNNGATSAKMFINDRFYQDIAGTVKLKLLKEVGEAKFTRYGYRDTTFRLDTINSIQLDMQPYSYSSLTDSTIFDFNTGLNPRYWKTISIKNTQSISNVEISGMQYDDAFNGLGLQPQSRKFVFRNIGANPAGLRTAIALDQAVTPDIDSVYLLSIKNGKYTKYQANQAGLSEYDPVVQKLAFDSLSLKPNEVQEIVLMRKQAPIALQPAVQVSECQTQTFPVSMFVKDPDSLKNDLTVVSSNPKVQVIGNSIQISGSFGLHGILNFSLSCTHDFITVNPSYTVTVVPCPIYISNTFTPNGDGVNDTWEIPDLANFSKCEVDIFARSGSRVFHSTGYGKAWDGTLNNTRLPVGVYYYIIQPNEPGYNTISGNVTIIR